MTTTRDEFIFGEAIQQTHRIFKENDVNQNLTDLIFVVDRSGSMESCQKEAETGLNKIVDDQKNEEGDCNFTLVQFDTEYEVVHDGVPIKDVPHIPLVPRGMTALNDAVGQAINTVGERLGKMDEADRPGLVTLVIVTDGGENASQEFNRQQVHDMIKTQEETYNWKVIYLGANQDAFKESAQIGIAQCSSANYKTCNTAKALKMMSSKVSNMRHSVSQGGEAFCSFSADERTELAE